ncbi:outer membrane protein assembly factor BamB family protein [Pontibacter sp. H249]|uniref:outer membrane protein assembly factor BamB family protein n=1 Tax=Pontibacter sp. H249 TaxID=3133420 RepID=UPI0030C4DE94
MKNFLLNLKGPSWSFLAAIYFILFLVPLLVSGQNVKEEWAQLYDASTTDSLQNDFIAVDESGNLYTASIRLTAENRKYIQVSKFSIEGIIRWVNIYNTSAGGFLPDININKIATDEAGDLYIIGSSQGSDNRNQSLTLKFSTADGRLLWEQAFRIGMFSDAQDIKFDNQGAVYVLSTTDGGPERTLSNITTTKINSADGTVLWGKTYDGGVNGSDTPKAIALDNQEGVYVVGSSAGAGTGTDIVTIKYNAETGEQEWLQRLDIDNQTQEALGVTADNAGGVYTTGAHGSSSGAEDTEALLVRYDAADGTQQWLTVEADSNNQNLTLPNLPISNAEGLFVIQGEAGVSNSTKVVKYNATDGSIAWAQTYSGTPSATHQDDNGDILVVGSSFDTGNILIVKYSKLDGSVIWEQENQGSTSGILSSVLNRNQGILLVAAQTLDGDANAGALVLTYSIESGENFIVAPIALGQSNEAPVAIAVDEDGNTYVAGNLTSSAAGSSFILLKYSPDGALLWESEEVANTAMINAMVIGKEGDIYVTGTRRSNAIYTAKFDQNDGAKVWEKNFTYVGNEGNIGYALALNNTGELYVTGTVKGRLTDGMAVLKYNAETGDEIWNSVLIQPIDINNTTFLNYIGRALALDEAGDIYIAGELRERQSDYLIAKVQAEDGQIAWSKTYGSSSSIFERATAIEAAETGEIYVTGISNGDFATIKLNPSDGTILWESRLENNSPGSGTGANALALDNKGSIYVTGQKAGSIDAVTVKYNAADGSEVWRSALENTIGYKIKADSIGGVYVAGANLTVVKYLAENGSMLWEQRADTLNGNFVAMALDDNLNVYVTGGVQRQTVSNSDILTVKYNQTGGTDTCNIPVNVKLYLPDVAKRVGWQVRTTGNFGSYTLTEDTGVRWTWGDGSNPTISYTAFGTPRITGEHTYQKAGLYKIGLDFNESCLTASNTGYEQWMPIFDPEAGTVKGEGTMQQESGGTLSFNLNVAYGHRYNTAPQFWQSNFIIEGLGEFQSSSVQWLVVTENKAAWQGEGTLNGTGYYGFITSVTDAGGTGPDDTGDRLRLKIWDKSRGNRLVYDSFAEGGEILDLSNQGPTIARGNIIIQDNGSSTTSTESAISLEAYPNTFTERTAIAFRLQQGQQYHIDIYDTKGNFVQRLAEGSAIAGKDYEYVLNGTGLDNGLYIARLVTPKASKSIKLLLKRH